jgi:hypothetical protein
MEHREGSAKGKVHAVWTEKGPEAAFKKAVALGKAESTARTWNSEFKKDAEGGKKKSAKPAPAKKAAKSSGKKAAKAAKPAKKRVRNRVKRERIEEGASA